MTDRAPRTELPVPLPESVREALEAAQEAKEILGTLAKSAPVRGATWTLEDDFICAAHARLAAALAAVDAARTGR